MQKQKIQDVCHADYYRTAQQLLFRILEWFESSSKLTGPGQGCLYRYALLQDTLGSIDTRDVVCEQLARTTTAVTFTFRLRWKSNSSTVQLPLVTVDARCKGTITSITPLQREEDVCSALGLSGERSSRTDNVEVLKAIQTGLRSPQVAVGIPKDLEDSVPHPSDNISIADPEVHRSGWTMFETASSGSGVGGPDLQIGDMIYTVPVAATQNNIPILVSLVFRTHSNGQLRPVSYAMDHLGFKASDRRAPSRALVARMPLSRRKEDRGQDIRLHLDPKTALEVTGGKEWRTLGYGWRTLKRLGNVYTSIA